MLTATYKKCTGRVRLGAREDQPITPRVAGTVGRVGHCRWQCMGPAVVAAFSCPPLHRDRLPKTGLAMPARSCCQSVLRYRHDCASGEGGGIGRVQGRHERQRARGRVLLGSRFVSQRPTTKAGRVSAAAVLHSKARSQPKPASLSDSPPSEKAIQPVPSSRVAAAKLTSDVNLPAAACPAAACPASVG